jgi:hypothetical protein
VDDAAWPTGKQQRTTGQKWKGSPEDPVNFLQLSLVNVERMREDRVGASLRLPAGPLKPAKHLYDELRQACGRYWHSGQAIFAKGCSLNWAQASLLREFEHVAPLE